jgi:hypothetical protein
VLPAHPLTCSHPSRRYIGTCHKAMRFSAMALQHLLNVRHLKADSLVNPLILPLSPLPPTPPPPLQLHDDATIASMLKLPPDFIRQARLQVTASANAPLYRRTMVSRVDMSHNGTSRAVVQVCEHALNEARGQHVTGACSVWRWIPRSLLQKLQCKTRSARASAFNLIGHIRHPLASVALAIVNIMLLILFCSVPQVCEAAGYAEGFSITSAIRRNLARAIPLHLKHASEVFGEEIDTFHCVDCR